ERSQGHCEAGTSGQALRASMGRPTRLDRSGNQVPEAIGEQTSVGKGYRSQAHNRPIPTGELRRVTRSPSVAGLLEPLQGGTVGGADVEPPSVHGIRSGPPPRYVSFRLVVQIPPLFRNAVSQGESHAGIVGPFPWLQPVQPPAAVAENGLEGAGNL